MAFAKVKIKESAKILQLKNEIEPTRGLIYTDEGPAEQSLRSTEVRWITRESHSWVFSVMQQYARQVQSDLGLDSVLKIVDNIQLSTYKEGDYYGWHKDCRLLSCSVLLSNNFSGGRLEFAEPGAPLLRNAGQGLFFTDQLHRVKPVLKGTRDSLVVWWQ